MVTLGQAQWWVRIRARIQGHGSLSSGGKEASKAEHNSCRILLCIMCTFLLKFLREE